MSLSPSPIHRCRIPSTPLTAKPGPSTPTPSTHSPVLQDLNTAYASSGSAISATRTSPSPIHPSPHQPLTPLTAKPQAPSTPTPSTRSGAAADLNTAYDSSGISGLGDEPVTLTDTSLDAYVLNSLDGHTSGTVNASSINELTGAANQIDTSYASVGINNLDEAAATQTPSIALTKNINSLGIGTTATITFTLSESSNDFTESDITVESGTLSGFSGSGTSYFVTFTPNPNSTTEAAISVGSGRFSNSLANLNRDGSDANNSVTFSVDTVRPTITISSDVTSLEAGDTATLIFTLSESSTNFQAEDLTVSNGTISNFSGSGTSYSAIFTPTAESTTAGIISVASSKFSDSIGNTNADGSDNNNSVSLSIDTRTASPTTSPTPSPTQNPSPSPQPSPTQNPLSLTSTFTKSSTLSNTNTTASRS